MTKSKAKRFDCVEVKQRVQRELLEDLKGHSPREQYEIIRQLADDLPLWKALDKTRPKTTTRTAKAPARRRKTG